MLLCLIQLVFSQNIPMKELDHDYSDYEPLFTEESLELHHQQIENQYVRNLNSLLRSMRKNPATNKITKQGIDYIVTHLDEIENDKLRNQLNIYGGGYVLHDLFWKCIVPQNEFTPLEGELKDDLLSQYDSYDEFINEFTNIAIQYDHPGWIWFTFNPKTNRFEIYFTNNNEHIQNQNKDVEPLFLLDLWEHSFISQYSNDRFQYIQAFFNQINWPYINKHYEEYKKTIEHSEL